MFMWQAFTNGAITAATLLVCLFFLKERKLIYIVLNERSQSEKAIDCKIPTPMHSGKGRIIGSIEWWAYDFEKGMDR